MQQEARLCQLVFPLGFNRITWNESMQESLINSRYPVAAGLINCVIILSFYASDDYSFCTVDYAGNGLGVVIIVFLRCKHGAA
jgi:hypothetical protein